MFRVWANSNTLGSGVFLWQPDRPTFRQVGFVALRRFAATAFTSLAASSGCFAFQNGRRAFNLAECSPEKSRCGRVLYLPLGVVDFTPGWWHS